MNIKEAMALMAMDARSTGGPPPPGGWGKGRELLPSGKKNSRYNQFQISPQSMEDLLMSLHANMERRKEKSRTRGMGGLFGGDHPRRKN